MDNDKYKCSCKFAYCINNSKCPCNSCIVKMMCNQFCEKRNEFHFEWQLINMIIEKV